MQKITAKQFGVSIQFAQNALKEYNQKESGASFNDIGRGKHQKEMLS